MGVGDHPSMNERNAANEAAFKELPAAGSPAYWARLEDTTATTRLPLEVLVMCARERLAAGRSDQTEQAFNLLLKKVQGSVQRLIGRLTPHTARDRARLIEDIEQECAITLWQEIAHPAPTFLTEGFWHKVKLMTMNIIEQRLIAEGVKTRDGVAQPTRVPQSQSDSLDQPVGSVGSEDDRTLADSVADRSDDPFSLIEQVSDIKALLTGLTAEERLLLANEVTGERTQVEMGKSLGKTDRAVRMQIEKLRARLRARRNPPTMSSGSEAGGEEG